MEHVNQKWNIEIQLLPSDKATHILERAETAALRGCKNFPQNCFLRSQLGFYSGGSGHCVCSEAVWVTQTSRERTGHTLPQQALQNLRPRLSRSSGLCTSTSCSLQCPALALHPFCLLIIGSLQIIFPTSSVLNSWHQQRYSLFGSLLMLVPDQWICSGEALSIDPPAVSCQSQAPAEGPWRLSTLSLHGWSLSQLATYRKAMEWPPKMVGVI